MIQGEVDCDNCGDIFTVTAEDECCGDGMEIERRCPECGWYNRIESVYNHAFGTLDASEIQGGTATGGNL